MYRYVIDSMQRAIQASKCRLVLRVNDLEVCTVLDITAS